MAIEVNGTDIPNGSEFYVDSTQVQEAYCNGILVWWFEVEPPDEVPVAITDFNASDNLTGRVEITFTPSSNAIEHDLYRDGSMVKDKVTSGFEDVITAGTYTYYVKAHNDVGDTDSNQDNGTSVAEQGGTPPSIINNFSASDDIVGTIVLSFTNASGDPTPTHDLIRVSTGSTIVRNISSGHSWSTTEQNVLLRVDAKNVEGVTPSNTDYGSAREDAGPVTDFTASDTECRKVIIQYTKPSPDSSDALWFYDTVYTTGWAELASDVYPGYITEMNSAYFDKTIRFKVICDGEDSNEDTGALYIPPLNFEGTSASGTQGNIDSITFTWNGTGNSDVDHFDIVDKYINAALGLTIPSNQTSYVLTPSNPAWEDHFYHPHQDWRIDAFGTVDGCAAREGTSNFGAYASEGIDPPGSQIFTASGTFNAPSGYTYVSLCMVGSGGAGGTAATGAWGGAAGQVVNTTHGISSGQNISVTVPGTNTSGNNGSTSFFDTTGAGGGLHSSHTGNGGLVSTCGGSSSDGNMNSTTSAWGGQGSGFGNGGHGSNTGGFSGGIGAGGGAGTSPNIGGAGGRGEVRVTWGYGYWDVIPGYNDMTDKEKWIAIEGYNHINSIPEWMISDPKGLMLTVEDINQMENK